MFELREPFPSASSYEPPSEPLVESKQEKEVNLERLAKKLDKLRKEAYLLTEEADGVIRRRKAEQILAVVDQLQQEYAEALGE